MEWYYYEPLSYFRFFIISEFDDKLGVIEVDVDEEILNIQDFGYYTSEPKFILGRNLKKPSPIQIKKVSHLLEEQSHKLIKKIFNYN